MKPIGGYTAEDRAPIVRFKCTTCGAKPRDPCASKSGNPCNPHKARVVRARKAKRFLP